MSKRFVCALFCADCLIARTAWTNTRIFAAELVELKKDGKGTGVSGDITILVAKSPTAGVAVVGSIKIRGLKADIGPMECGGGKNKIQDQCRTYMHTGNACTDEASQGPRHQEGTTTDPWRTIGYVMTDGSGAAELGFTHYNYPEDDADVSGNPFIIYDETGARAACGILRQAGLPIYTAKLARHKIPSTSETETDKPPVEGEVMIVASTEGVLGIGELRNVEPGIEGHYTPYLSMESTCNDVPMKTPKVLQSSFNAFSRTGGKAGTSSFRLVTPHDWFEDKGNLLAIEGYRIAIYGVNGAPWSCGILACSSWPVYTADLVALQPSSSVSGTVTIATSRTGLLGVGSGTNLEKGLRSSTDGGNDCTAENGCGAHVHKGTACLDAEGRSSAELQGSHYHINGETDPWASVGYLSTDTKGGAFFHFNVKSVAVKIAGKPFILHDKNGGRVACGILTLSFKTQLYVAELEALSGNQAVGRVAMLALATGVIGLGSVSGLQANLEESDCATDAACAAILYDGSECRDESARGTSYYKYSELHLADEPKGWLTQDPWKSSRYSKTYSLGDASFDFALTTGHVSIKGRPFVVQNKDGNSIVCGVLEISSSIVGAAQGSSSSNQSVGPIVIIVVLVIACIGGLILGRKRFFPAFVANQDSTESDSVNMSQSQSRTVSLVNDSPQGIELTDKKSVKW